MINKIQGIAKKVCTLLLYWLNSPRNVKFPEQVIIYGAVQKKSTIQVYSWRE